MRIAIGCDHRGLTLKQSVIKLINEEGKGDVCMSSIVGWEMAVTWHPTRGSACCRELCGAGLSTTHAGKANKRQQGI